MPVNQTKPNQTKKSAGVKKAVANKKIKNTAIKKNALPKSLPVKTIAPQPITIWLRNTTDKTVKDFHFLYPYEFMGHEGFKDGNLLIDGVEISCSVPATPYDSLLRQFAATPVNIDKLKFQFDQCRPPLDLWMSIKVLDASWDGSVRSVVLSDSYNKEENEIKISKSFTIDGGTSLVLSEIGPLANILLTLYPLSETEEALQQEPWGQVRRYGTYVIEVQNDSGETKKDFKFLSPIEYFTHKDLKDTLVIDGVKISSGIRGVSLRHLFGQLMYNQAKIECANLHLTNCEVPEKFILTIISRYANGNTAHYNGDLKGHPLEYAQQVTKNAFQYKGHPFHINALSQLKISELPAGASLIIWLHEFMPTYLGPDCIDETVKSTPKKNAKAKKTAKPITKTSKKTK